MASLMYLDTQYGVGEELSSCENIINICKTPLAIEPIDFEFLNSNNNNNNNNNIINFSIKVEDNVEDNKFTNLHLLADIAYVFDTLNKIYKK